MTNENLIVSIWKKDGLANNIAKYVGQKKEMTSIMQSRNYTNEEFNPTFQQVDPDDLEKGFACKDNRIYIIAPNNPIEGYSPQETFARTQLAANAAKENGAKKITIVMPDLVYSRADRAPSEDPKMMGGKAYALYVLAKTYAAIGVDKVLTINHHSKDTQKIFNHAYHEILNKYEHKNYNVVHDLSPVPIIAHYLMSRGLIDIYSGRNNAVFLDPDRSSKRLLDDLFDMLSLDDIGRVSPKKSRSRANDPDAVSVDYQKYLNLLEGKDVFFIDDGADTMGTMIKTFEPIKKARNRYFYATHLWLAGNLPDDTAQDLLMKSNVDLAMFGNTHPDRIHTLSDDLLNNKVVFFDFSKYLADAIVNHVSKGRNPKKHYFGYDLEDLLEVGSSWYDVIDKRIKK